MSSGLLTLSLHGGAEVPSHTGAKEVQNSQIKTFYPGMLNIQTR